MAIETRVLEYSDGGTTLCGQMAWDPSISETRPGVLVAHTWAGCGEFELQKAVALARLGYVALAVDMYGGGVIGSGPEENLKLMTPLVEDRTTMQRRMNLALDALKGLGSVDESRTAAIGYCFGGMCVLDLARTGAALGAGVSFHGLLGRPDNLEPARIQAKILVLHGWNDPMAKPPEVDAIASELTQGGADWQIHAYGNAMHAFTNPDANDHDMGTVYDAKADSRSWRAMRDFLEESLGGE